ncbi:hypothetical protein FNV43_RR27349 [Rhamnella rubrinervis]|uniref:Uncharacterized protein n=1 Tax=Rhamnella rubrinervis TaxID=2594499 RepID=A0A8K0GNE7_9ROSA|nr:hypothetical protein FNV43_RR27349 [Rhamnella rubrinervis]
MARVNMTTTNISKLATKVDLSVSTDRSTNQSERPENEKEIFHKEKQLCIHCKYEIEAEIRLEKDIKNKGKAMLKPPLESYGPYNPKRNSKTKFVFIRLGSMIDQVQLRLSCHKYPIKPTGWDLDKPRQHNVRSTNRHTKRRDWTLKTFRSPIKEIEEYGIVDPLVETSNGKNDVTADSSTKNSKDKDDDFLAKTSKVKTTDFMTDKISSASDDYELFKELESHLYRMEG